MLLILPFDILEIIFNIISLPDKLNIMLTCKQLKVLLENKYLRCVIKKQNKIYMIHTYIGGSRYLQTYEIFYDKDEAWNKYTSIKSNENYIKATNYYEDDDYIIKSSDSIISLNTSTESYIYSDEFNGTNENINEITWIKNKTHVGNDFIAFIQFDKGGCGKFYG